jgi:hypothetical protein
MDLRLPFKYMPPRIGFLIIHPGWRKAYTVFFIRKMKLTNKKIIKIALAIVILHFVLTSAAGYYIAVQQGRQLGKLIAEKLAEILEARQKESPQEAHELAQRITQDLKLKREELIKKWEIPTILVSLPARYFLEPLLNEFNLETTKKFLSKEISLKQFRTRERLMSVAANLVNSFAIGLLVYAILIIINLKSKPAKRRKRTKHKSGRKSGRTLAKDKVYSKR